MIRNFSKNRVVLILIISILVLTVVSCGQKQEKPKEEETKDKIPQELKSMSEDSEKIIEEVEKLQEEVDKPLKYEDESKNKEENKEGSKEEGQQKQEKEEMSEEEKNKEKILMKEEKIYKMWESIASKIESIHGGFNDYQAKALEAGATEEDINKLKKALDELTLAVDKKDDKLSLEKLNQMNFYMARFFDFYKGNIDAEILRIKYYTREVHLDGMMNKWNEAEKNIEEITPIYERLDQKVKLEEKDKPLMDKLKFAIDDLGDSIKYKSEKLLKIKRDIILKNLDSIKDATK